MTKNYVLFSSQLFSIFYATIINDVASSCVKKIKAARINFVVVFILLGAFTLSHQAIVHSYAASALKTPTVFINHYLTYASSHGIGGGGGGGHGGKMAQLLHL